MKSDNLSLKTQVAVLVERVDTLTEKQAKDIDTFNKRQEAHHENVKKIGQDIGLLRLDVQNWSLQTQQVVADHKDIKEVIKNNTEAVNSLRDMVCNIQTQKETTKSNISILGKVTLFVTTMIGFIYAGIQAIEKWGKP